MNINFQFWYIANVKDIASQIAYKCIRQFAPNFLDLSIIKPRPLHLFYLNLSKKWLAVSVPQMVPDLCCLSLPKWDLNSISNLEK